MKREIYISNLAFSNHNFNLLKKIVKNYNLQGIDFAPINLWNNWANLKKKVFTLKNFLEKNKIKINAVQGIFYKKDFNLLLSRGAEIDTKPSLEIYADDVKCSHGATAGHVDIDTLFYLMSRGLHKRTATEMLIKGFADEIINQIQLDQVKAFVQKDVEDLLPDLNFEE